ncbi:hypothetical protein D3C85_1891000 [compost metagenome]
MGRLLTVFSGKELFDDCADVFLAVLECSVAKATSSRLIQCDLIEAGDLPLSIQLIRPP